MKMPYTAAGSVASLFAPLAFVADDVFMTTAGDLGLVWRLRGADSESLDPAQRDQIVSRFLAVLQRLNERHHVYSYLIKTRTSLAPPASDRAPRPVMEALERRLKTIEAGDGGVFAIDLYLTIVYECGSATRTTASLWRRTRMWWSPNGVRRTLTNDLLRSVAELQRMATMCEAQLADVGPTRLGKEDAYRFLRRLVTYSGPDVRLKHAAPLNYFMADGSIEDHRDSLHVGSAHVKVLTMKDAPADTFADALVGLAELPGEGIACVEWRHIPIAAARAALAKRKRHFGGSARSFTNYFTTGDHPLPTDVILNSGALAMSDLVGTAQEALEQGRSFGECSLTLVLHDRDLDRVERIAASAMRAMADRDGYFIEETYNRLSAFASIVPGNHRMNVRRLWMLDVNAADLAFVFTPDAGDPASAFMVWNGRCGVPFHYALKASDVGHTLLLGSIGSGKSFALGNLLFAAQQIAARTFVFDLGNSYQRIAGLLDAPYVQIGLHSGVPLNPFALAPTPEHLHFIHGFCSVLLEGRNTERMSEDDRRGLYTDVQNVYRCPAGERRLSSLDLPRRLRDRLLPWIGDGRFAQMFDHAEDALSLARFQVFEFSNMDQFPDVLEPLLFLILHRIRSGIADAGLTLVAIDEAWRFIQHPSLRAYVHELIKTGRKLNVSMFLATQQIDDFASSDLLRTVIEGCHTKLFLANKDLCHKDYRELFHLNETEVDIVTALQPKSEVYLQRPGVGKVLQLRVPDNQIPWFGASAEERAVQHA